jgi:hypothetical protein
MVVEVAVDVANCTSCLSANVFPESATAFFSADRSTAAPSLIRVTRQGGRDRRAAGSNDVGFGSVLLCASAR